MAAIQPQISAETCLDGVSYAVLSLDRHQWRLGSINPEWRQIIAAHAPDRWPAPGQSGIWIESYSDKPARTGIMCCGLGSAWPGMGRELYAYFPAARQAMDEIAALADWDVLGLMDEKDIARISQSRWQIPYLFMLEYAQWRQFQAYGLMPELICGHSLGELIALCLAGIYDLTSAWYLLETRAEHMSELEASGGREGGMLAVPAGYDEIAPVLARWPELRISNRNTYKQYILGGPRAQLLEARRTLRRKRIPAVMLNMDLAFHNPAMRILRDLSYRRLNGLNMQPPSPPVLSCVDARPYPSERSAICRRITDLDENTVDWVGLIETVGRQYPLDIFLELGPQETLCAISSELEAGIDYIAADRKSHEALAMKSACARLFAAGSMAPERIFSASATSPRFIPGGYFAQPVASANSLDGIDPEEIQTIFGLLAELCDKDASDISPEDDLRYDLGLRSINFPYLMLEAEQRLGHPVILENLFQLNTVADLVRFLSGSASSRSRSTEASGAREDFIRSRAPLAPYNYLDGKFYPCESEPGDNSIFGTLKKISAIIMEPAIDAAMFDDLAKQGAPEIFIDSAPAAFAKESVWLAAGGDSAAPDGREYAFDAAIVILPDAVCGEAEAPDDILDRYRKANPGIRTLILRRFGDDEHPAARAWLDEQEEQAGKTAIAWLESEANINGRDFTEARRLLMHALAGDAPRVLWKREPQLPLVIRKEIPEKHLYFSNEDRSGRSAYEIMRQYSLYSEPEIAEHGARAQFTPLSQTGDDERFWKDPYIPVGMLYDSLMNAASLLEPDLKAIGFAAWRLFRIPSVPQGITRECRLTASNRLSLWQEGVAATLAHIGMDEAELTRTGRKSGRWAPVAVITYMMTRENPPIAPLWQGPSRMGAAWDTQAGNGFYELLQYGARWRLISGLRRAKWPNGSWGSSCMVDYADVKPDACGEHTIEAVFQAALATLLLKDGEELDKKEMFATLQQWKFASIGFCRFDFTYASGRCRLELCNSWLNERLIRFDGQIYAGNGKIIFAAHNLEFELVPGTDIDQPETKALI